MADTDLHARLSALRATSPKKDAYGTHECGCTWDSGPYTVYCEDHDAEDLLHDAVTELVAAIDTQDADAQAKALAIVKALLADPTAGTDNQPRMGGT